MTPCVHKVQYYETDQMKIVHHSNYIRWFEEARSHLMDEINYGYHRMEEEGIVIPVLSVRADYKGMVRYGETVEIEASIREFTGVKMVISYVVRDSLSKEVRTVGESKHAFLNKDTYRPLSLKRGHKNLFDLFNTLHDAYEKEAVK
ncbi:acyl-CoA thioesterase [Alkalibacterium olivapovliticus]|uniref:Acyl-CoA thioester hydrolase n=1 Tax=Alkalibacterium olivapovliticus TaxID=99907 RepID=A0A2T0WAD4_9LACT|nr:acyl-CoA thioesterase [Alkalibacterium olivapovliticus]PRY83675.1 acyl-CoA thioester hydrolase [Alkalibacterium olivapovliticus]